MLFRRHSVAGLFGVAEAAIPKNRLIPSRPISTWPRIKAASAQQGTVSSSFQLRSYKWRGKSNLRMGNIPSFLLSDATPTEELE
jgi:hypothetical protein